MPLPSLLIIDDEVDLGEIIAEYLAGTFSSTVCSDPQKAVDLIKNNHFDLILSDLQMPHIDGFGIIELTMSLSPQIPVVILTGHSQFDPFSKKALEAGAKGILVKPLESPTKLASFLRQFLNN